MKNIAIILASGQGSRFGTVTPKQFIKLAGKPVIQYTIETFERAQAIDEIIIVTLPEYADQVRRIINKNLFKKTTKVIIGGKERYDSTWSALQTITDEEANLLIHDAVRPFISERIINECIASLSRHTAVDVVIDAVDTIVEVEDDLIRNIPDRRYLKYGQTPQAFKKTILLSAYKKFMQDKHRIASDDCGIVLRYLPDEKIAVVKGDESNFKLTHQQDIYLADNLIKDGLIGQMAVPNKEPRNSLKNKVVFIIGASSGIGADIAELCSTAGAYVYGCSRQLNNVDITDIKTLEKSLRDCRNKFEKIDYVINTSGLLIHKPFLNMSAEEIAQSYMVNYVGVLNLAHCSFPYLKKSKGMLINFSSSSYTRGRAYYSIYSSSKAAIVNFSQALSDEWQDHGVKVNVINPERTDTPMRRVNFGLEPKETLLSSEKVAEFTLSVMCSEHTGQVYSIKKDL